LRARYPQCGRHGIDLFYVKDDPAFDNVGNIAALLRFRSESKVRPISAAAARPSLGAQEGLVGHYRGVEAKKITVAIA
jgi:hypothetical protein